MRYRTEITAPANTPISDPVLESMSICAGIIDHVWVLQPSGHAGLTGVQVFYLARQIFPTTPGQWFKGDGDPNTFPDEWPAFDAPHELEIRMYNLDDTYDHTSHIEISIAGRLTTAWLPEAAPALPEGVE